MSAFQDLKEVVLIFYCEIKNKLNSVFDVDQVKLFIWSSFRDQLRYC